MTSDIPRQPVCTAHDPRGGGNPRRIMAFRPDPQPDRPRRPLHAEENE
jgi:hypothetical protein